jgi:glycosyltransferase involved in cell wall biosynthesis
MHYIRKAYYHALRLLYLIKKLFAFNNKRIVIYTKNHPIYHSIFEETKFHDFTFVCLDLNKKLNLLERILFKQANIVHTDAGKLFFPKNAVDKPIVIECEGCPYDWFFTNENYKHVFLESKWAGEDLISGTDLEVIYPSIKIPPRNSFRKTMPLTITAVGHGGLVKGFDVVIALYKEVRKSYDVKLIIAGTTGLDRVSYPELTEYAHNKANFPALLRSLEDDPNVSVSPIRRGRLFTDIYPSTDIYLHLSRLETFGYSVLEAISHGIPAIASNLHAIPEMIVHGETGFLVNDFADDINSDEWFIKSFNEGLTALQFLIANPVARREMGDNAYERTKRIFDIEIKKEKLNNIYNSIIFRK